MIQPANQHTVIVPAAASHLAASRIFQGIPSIACTSGGRIFATWYTGEKGEYGDNYVLLVHSDDDGATWSDAEYVVLPREAGIRAFDPTLFCTSDGRLFIFWAQSFSPEGEKNDFRRICDGHAGVWYSILENPDAAPAEFSFSPCRRICDGIMMNKPAVLDDGTWALPISVWHFPQHYGDVEGYDPGTKMYVSTDNGNSFQFRGQVLIPEDKSNFDEHSICQLSDGRLMMLIRVLGGFMETFSCDQGRTWSEPVMSKLQSPCTRAFLGRLPSGKLLLVYNRDTKLRRNLTATISEDDGKTWNNGILIDGRNGCSYPDAAITADGTILLIHDYCRYYGGYILFSRLTEADIAAGRPIGDKSCLNYLVSSTRPVTGWNATAPW